MFLPDSPLFSSGPVVGVIAVGAVLLLWVLRRMRVRIKYLAWTVVAHGVFILLLGVTMAPSSSSSRALDDDTMVVLMLPPIMREEPQPDEAFVPVATKLRLVLDERVPETAGDESRASRFLGGPTTPGVASARLQAIAPRDDAAELGTIGVPTRRTDFGEIGGASVSALPDQIPSVATDNSATLRALEPRGERAVTDIYERRRPDTRTEVAGPDVERAHELGLPSGYSIGGDVEGRDIRYLPPLPEVQGTDVGTVKVRFYVSADGRVYDVNIIRRSGYPMLEQEARRWVERMQFAPLDPSANPAAQYGEIEIDFSKFQ